jgi:hypothetical protein
MKYVVTVRADILRIAKSMTKYDPFKSVPK